jgi:hypothetical protein
MNVEVTTSEVSQKCNQQGKEVANHNSNLIVLLPVSAKAAILKEST